MTPAGLEKYVLDLSEITKAGVSRIPAVPLKKFENLPFILLKPANDSRRRADLICAEQGFEPKVIMEFDQQMTAYLASCSGIGIAFVGSMFVSRTAPNASLNYFRLGVRADAGCAFSKSTADIQQKLWRRL